MRVSKEKSAENRARILDAAARLFREQGVSGVGVDALTDAAGLSHGSLYSQFGSKERLAGEAMQHALQMTSARMSDVTTLHDYIAHYLTLDHRERRGDGCVIAALAGEMPRQADTLRHGFTDAVRGFMKKIARLSPAGRRTDDEALAIVATMVGALTLARAVDNPELAERILKAARSRLLAQ